MNSPFDISHRDNKTVILTPKTQKHTNFLTWLGSIWLDYFTEGGVANHVKPIYDIFLTFSGLQSGSSNCSEKVHHRADIFTLNASNEDVNHLINMDSCKDSTERLYAFLDQEIAELGGDSTKCFAGGFSMGAMQASYVWKTYQKTLGGLIIYSSFAIKNLEVAKEQECSPVLWAHGLDDCVLQSKHGCLIIPIWRMERGSSRRSLEKD